MNPSTHLTKPDPDSSRIAEAAAAWRARCDASLDARAEADFAAWLGADARHAAVFAEMDATWTILDRAKEVPPAILRTPPMQLLEPAPGAAQRRSPRVWWGTGLAAAAAIVIAFAGWRAWRTPVEIFATATEVGAGLVQRVNLPDGSVVRLNADSAMSVHFTEQERRVMLTRGEASFDVAKNPRAPFVVTGAGVSVRAVGTAFNVALRAAAVEVLVTEGKVSVDDATRRQSLLLAPATGTRHDEPAHLRAGEKVTIPVANQHPARAVLPVVVDAPAIAQALAWQERRLDFASAPLAEIAAEFNRFNQHKLVIADAELARQRFAGSFRADDPDTFVQLIGTRRDVVVEWKPGETILRRVK